MTPPNDDLPAPPDLPSFTVEDSPDPKRHDPRRPRDSRDGRESGGRERGEAREPAPEPHQRYLGTGLVRHDVALDEDRIDPDAAKVVRRLERAGHQAYLVGGCVRDLLLDGKPKDFDVATSARPEDVPGPVPQLPRSSGGASAWPTSCSAAARSSRSPPSAATRSMEAPEDAGSEVLDDLLIRSDNVFGEAHEDALRRDFTMNALFYDLDRRQVLDWCGGMQDVAMRTIHTIGDPTDALPRGSRSGCCAPSSSRRGSTSASRPTSTTRSWPRATTSAKAARPRVFEEILRLTAGRRRPPIDVAALGDGRDGGAPARARRVPRRRGGHRRRRHALLPEDGRHRRHDPGAGRALDDTCSWTLLLKEPLDEACAGERDRVRAATDFIDPIIEHIAVPRRIADAVRRIVAILPRLTRAAPGASAGPTS